ncbi:MAG: BTAD domain-containing putative transcriptional regulator [Candidatus Xenobia bacterium]
MEGHAGLVECLLAEGRRDEARRQYQECVRLTRRILNLPPSERLLRLFEMHLRI